VMNEQVVPALMAALIGEGVAPELIEKAVGRVCDLQLGASLSTLGLPCANPQLVRAFVFEQSALLDRAR
jgi:hypothetical protein